MIRSLFLVPPRAARRLAALGGALALLAVVPALGQQNRPSVRFTVPPVLATKRHTRLTVDFSLPAGFTLVGRPRIRAVGPKGEERVLGYLRFTRRPPEGQGYIDLNTEDFPEGPHRLRVEIDYLDPSGKRGTESSPVGPMVVPQRKR